MRGVNTKQHKKKQTRIINTFELLLVMVTSSFILVLLKLIGVTNPVLYDLNKFSHTLYGYFYTGPVCFYLLYILQTMPVKRRNLRSVQRLLAMNNTLILLHQIVSLK